MASITIPTRRPCRPAPLCRGDGRGERLAAEGYEVYRFGGDELADSPATAQLLDTFFDRLTVVTRVEAAVPSAPHSAWVHPGPQPRHVDRQVRRASATALRAASTPGLRAYRCELHRGPSAGPGDAVFLGWFRWNQGLVPVDQGWQHHGRWRLTRHRRGPVHQTPGALRSARRCRRHVPRVRRGRDRDAVARGGTPARTRTRLPAASSAPAQ